MIKDCTKHYSEMYRVRLMEDSCPFCTIEKLKTDIAMLEEANRTGNQHDDELISEARKQTAQEILRIISNETIDRPFEQSQAAEIIRQRYGLEG